MTLNGLSAAKTYYKYALVYFFQGVWKYKLTKRHLFIEEVYMILLGDTSFLR